MDITQADIVRTASENADGGSLTEPDPLLQIIKTCEDCQKENQQEKSLERQYDNACRCAMQVMTIASAARHKKEPRLHEITQNLATVHEALRRATQWHLVCRNQWEQRQCDWIEDTSRRYLRPDLQVGVALHVMATAKFKNILAIIARVLGLGEAGCPVQEIQQTSPERKITNDDNAKTDKMAQRTNTVAGVCPNMPGSPNGLQESTGSSEVRSISGHVCGAPDSPASTKGGDAGSGDNLHAGGRGEADTAPGHRGNTKPRLRDQRRGTLNPPQCPPGPGNRPA